MATKKPRGPAKSDAERTGKRIDAIHHEKEKRLLIPSREEAGQESESPVVQSKRSAEFPLNPVTTRGQDPELFWMHKYGPADDQTRLSVDIRSLYRHEHIEPETMIHRLYKISKSETPQNDFFVNETFGNLLGGVDELDKPKHYYKQMHDWRNRLIQGDSLLVMTSLLEREGMAGKVQMIYIDPPYGIKYGSNWQMRLNDTNVKDSDDNLSGEPEVIKAFRDTWELGIHSYLTYLRDRLLAARELLTETGSCFVQISDENQHLVRAILDEVFGSENFVSQIFFQKTGGFSPKYLSNIGDYLLWYSKNKTGLKYRALYELEDFPPSDDPNYVWLELADKSIRRMTPEERRRETALPNGARIFRHGPLQSSGKASKEQTFPFQGREYVPNSNSHWKVPPDKLVELGKQGHILAQGNGVSWKLFWDYNKAKDIANVWLDTQSGGFNESDLYVVQTTTKVIERCMLMTTDPGDLVLDPTCGSGTTAFVAEQFGRRWITSDTSRIAVNVAKARMFTATYPWYKLQDTEGADVRLGFQYKEVQYISLSTLAYNEPVGKKVLLDDPYRDASKVRVTGPFTVETLQSLNPTQASEIESGEAEAEGLQRFTDRIFAHLQSAGIKNGVRNENAIFAKINSLPHEFLHAEGWYTTERGDSKAYLCIGPQFGMVSRQAVNEAVKECRLRGDADWLVIMGFAFESDIENREVNAKLGGFMVTKVRMHDDLMQEGLVKKDKKAASFVTIGEPDIGAQTQKDGSTVIEIRGLDIYDPIKDEVKPRSVADIAYWMVDDDYDGASFIVRQVFFCGGDKDEFDKWKKGLSDLAKQMTKKKVEQTLKVEIDDEAFDRLYGFRSHPIPHKKGRRVAVRVVSQFGEESTKVISLLEGRMTGVKLQALKTTEIASWLGRLMEEHERYWWAVAWTTDNKLLDLLLKNRKRIEKLVVGTHFCQTAPEVLQRLKGVAGARMMDRDGDTFHPKAYLFADRDRGAWSAIVGSPNFTGAALSRNAELAVLLRGEDQSYPLFAQLRDAIGGYWNLAAEISDDELRRYRIQHAAMARHRIAIAKKANDIDATEGARHPNLLEYSWAEYAGIVRNERHFADRVRLLEKATELFRQRRTFARMSATERQAIAGLLREKEGSPDVLRRIEWRLFGSMTGMGDFQNRVKENDAHLSSALEAIPYVGDIAQQDYEDFVKEFRAAFRNSKHKGGVPTASRLLAMKRPDWFVCVDSRNVRDLAADLGFSRTTLDFDGYWDRIVCQVTLSAWWHSAAPKGSDRAIWNGRAALLDALYYRGLKGNQ